MHHLGFVVFVFNNTKIIILKIHYQDTCGHNSLTVVFLNFLLYFGNDLLNRPANPFVYSWKAYDAYNRNKRLIEISVLVLVIGQITFVVNMVAGLYKRTRGLH
jgi:hypothetical protein